MFGKIDDFSVGLGFVIAAVVVDLSLHVMS